MPRYFALTIVALTVLFEQTARVEQLCNIEDETVAQIASQFHFESSIAVILYEPPVVFSHIKWKGCRKSDGALCVVEIGIHPDDQLVSPTASLEWKDVEKSRVASYKVYIIKR